MEEPNESIEMLVAETYEQKFGKPFKWPTLDAVKRFKELLKTRGETVD